MIKKINNLRSKNTKDFGFNEFYITFCKCVIDLMNTRWIITAIFFGISFIILGCSFKLTSSNLSIFFMRILSIIIYWFAFIVFLLFNKNINFIVEYIMKMEESKKVDMNFQTSLREFMIIHGRIFKSSWFLFGFGIFYTLAILAIQYFYY